MATKVCGKTGEGEVEVSVMLRQFWFRETKIVWTHSLI